jgi:hypothetical protein
VLFIGVQVVTPQRKKALRTTFCAHLKSQKVGTECFS